MNKSILFLVIFVPQLLLTTFTQTNNPDFSLNLKHSYDILSGSNQPDKSWTNSNIQINKSNPTDSIIALAVSQINPDSIRYFIQNLQDFGTRYAYAPNHFQVAMWIKNEFERFGNITAELDSFLVDSVWMFNVVATLHGRITPENYVIIGGHYDSHSFPDPMTTAPGADDDASGTAAALEVARIITSLNYTPDVTIKFIAFDAEETGILGSKHYAEFAVNEGMFIKIMINNDMISYTAQTIEESKVRVSYGYSLNIKNLADNYFQNYSILTPIFSAGAGPDDQAFSDAGYKTLCCIEDDFNPYYHTPEETIDKLNLIYCAEIVKVNSAVLLKISDMPDEIDNFIAKDVGDGTSIKLSWTNNIESDVIGYKVSVGIDSSVYDTTYIVSDTISIVSGLQEGIEYFFGVKAIDSDGNEGFTLERSIVPNSFPLSPQNFADFPEWHKVKFSWTKNKELDLIGYNLYRSEMSNVNYIKVNQSIISDTTFTDENMVLGKYYYYILKAVDNDLNESNASQTIRSMAVSVDKGILLVDETKNGNGNLFEPTDEEVDQFYNNILSDFYHNNYDINLNGELKLADLGAYSTIIWQGNDNSDFTPALNAVNAIKQYLDFGGNVLFTGFSASKSFNGSISTSNSFETGDFIYDYLKIDTSINKLSTLFISAAPKVSSYNLIWVDSSKSSLATNYHIRKVEAISSNTEGTEIYTYNSNYDSTTSQGSMKGLPVGVEYIGNDYKTVILNIPLYYMNENQAKVLISYVLQNKFNELTDVEEPVKEVIPSEFVLYQNYPNPFNPTTRISWQAPVAGNQILKVYDVLGNEVTTLVNEFRNAGSYEIDFQSTVGSNQLANGVYFYQLRVGDFVETKKMILLK